MECPRDEEWIAQLFGQCQGSPREDLGTSDVEIEVGEAPEHERDPGLSRAIAELASDGKAFIEVPAGGLGIVLEVRKPGCGVQGLHAIRGPRGGGRQGTRQPLQTLNEVGARPPDATERRGRTQGQALALIGTAGQSPVERGPQVVVLGFNARMPAACSSTPGLGLGALG